MSPETDSPLVRALKPFRIGCWNLRGLQRPGYSPWPDFVPYSPAEYEGKLARIERVLRAQAPHVVGLQEVAEPEAFDDLGARLADLYPHRALGEPGTETPLRVGFLSCLPLDEVRSVREVPPSGRVALALGQPPVLTSFRRPVLTARASHPGGALRLLQAHLKAKRADLLESERGVGDPAATARGLARSLLVRGAEAAGLKALALAERARGRAPVVVLGDFNDGLDAVSTRILGTQPGSGQPQDPLFVDGEFYNTAEIQLRHRPRLPLFSHVWQGRPEMLDHLIVSGDLAARFQKLSVLVDELDEHDLDRTRSDHATLVASFSEP